MKNKIKVTPFLIANPLIIIWATCVIIDMLTRDGMAVIVSGFFFTLIIISSALLVVDRVIVRRVNMWVIMGFEVLILLGGLKFIDCYN